MRRTTTRYALTCLGLVGALGCGNDSGSQIGSGGSGPNHGGAASGGSTVSSGSGGTLTSGGGKTGAGGALVVSACGNGIVEGNEECDEQTTSCVNCRFTGAPPWKQEIVVPVSLLHPNGKLYGLDATTYAIQVLSRDARSLQILTSSIDNDSAVGAWNESKLFPLSDGGILSSVNVGASRVQPHLARYSPNGALNWAARLRNPGGNYYVAAADSNASAIAVAGMAHTGNSAYGNSAVIGLLDPDGVQTTPIEFAFDSRETSPTAVKLVGGGRICIAGSVWTATDEANQAGFVACFGAGGQELWSRALDAPALALRLVDAETIDVLTTKGWTQFTLGAGTATEPRALQIPTLTTLQAYSLGEHTLVGGYRQAKFWVGIIDASGAVRFSVENSGAGALIGLAPDGAAFIAVGGTPSYLTRYDTGITSTPDVSEPLKATTLAVGTEPETGACWAFCNQFTQAKCGALRGELADTRYECISACRRIGACQAEFDALRDCIAQGGSLTCTGLSLGSSGCSAQATALTTCEAAR